MANASDRFEMLPSDTDASIVVPFRILEADTPPPASQQVIYGEGDSAGSESLETGPDQAIIFRSNATASTASIVNNGGQTLFEDQSTAESSSLTANEQGYLRFSGSSTGARSTIVVNDGGLLDFSDDATAGSAKITANASVRFAGRSTAAEAEVVVNESGVVTFEEDATAGSGNITNSGSTGFFGSSTLAGATIRNNETGTVYFADDSTGGETSFIDNGGTVVFADRSTLGSGAITNNETGVLRFEDDSDAGDNFISSSGAVVFADRSSAADVEIVGNEGGLILFRDDSTAARATISGGAELRFAGRSTAGEASVTMAPGTTVSFVESADGGSARFQLDAGSALDIAVADNQVAVGRITGAGTVRLGANTLGVGDDTPLASFAGAIEDGGAGGSLVKRGEGMLNLSGQSSYSGSTTVEAGTLEAGAENAFAPRSAFTIADGARLALAGFDQEIGSLAGEGLVDLAAGSVLTTGRNDASTIFSGEFTGSGDLVKDGSGEFTLTGDSSHTGVTRVLGGLLRVDGDISLSALSVDVGGTLAGRGTVGNTDVAGTLLGEAGGDPLTVDGNLTLAGTATTIVEVDGTQAGRFEVTQDAQLDGVLVVRSAGGVPPGFEHVFLTARVVSGEYDEVRSDFAFLDASVVYGETSATLNLERNDDSFDVVAQTRNQRATAARVEELGQGNAVYDAVLPLSSASARAAFDSLSGEGHAAALGAMAAAHAEVRRTVLDRTRSVTAQGVWGDIQAGAYRLSSDGNGADAEADTVSLVGGADLVADETRQFGVYGYLGRTNLSIRDRSTHGSIERGGVGVYGAWRPDRWRVRGGADIAYGAIELDRRIEAGAFAGTASSDYGGWTASAYGEVAYAIEAGEVDIEPYAGLAYTHARTNGFSERGSGDADLTSRGSSHSRLDAEIGARASTKYQLHSGVVVEPGIGIGYIRNLEGAVATSTHAFVGGDDFTVAAARSGRDSAVIDMRIDTAFSHRVDAGMFYRGFLSDSEYSQLVGAGLRVAF